MGPRVNLTLLKAASLPLSSCVKLVSFSFEPGPALDPEKKERVLQSVRSKLLLMDINVLTLRLHTVVLGNWKCLDVEDTPLKPFEFPGFCTDECSGVRQGQINGRPSAAAGIIRLK